MHCAIIPINGGSGFAKGGMGRAWTATATYGDLAAEHPAGVQEHWAEPVFVAKDGDLRLGPS